MRQAARKSRSKIRAENSDRWEEIQEEARQRSKSWHSQNKDRRNERLKVSSQTEAHKASQVNRHRKYSHGVDDAQYQELFEKQDGVCAICKQPETAKHKKSGRVHSLTVDHDHRTGVVRGLLCRRCNTALGWFNDDEWLVECAMFYLFNARTAHRSDADKKKRQNAYVKK